MAHSQVRIAYYSHDALGLGHVRRNLALAGAIRRQIPDSTHLLIAGVPEATRLPRPPGCDVVTMPSIEKQPDGTYSPRYLGIPLSEVIAIRSALMAAALTRWAPDLLIVDKHPWGFRNELTPALDQLHTHGTTMVLGLRDVLDSPERTVADWERDHATEAISSHYDEVWVYGQPTIHDPLAPLLLPAEVDTKVHYLGYLADEARTAVGPHTADQQRPAAIGPFALCMVGAGSDGAELAQAMAGLGDVGMRKVILTGPQFPASALAMLNERARVDSKLEVLSHRDDPLPWIVAAQAVIAMGGYNSVCEALSARRPLLVVPRVKPRQEQLVRAKALCDAGVLDYLDPRELSSASLRHWLRRHHHGEPQTVDRVDAEAFQGLAAVGRRAEQLIDSAHQHLHSHHDPIEFSMHGSPQEIAHVR